MDKTGIKHRLLKYLPAYLLRYGSAELSGLGRFYTASHSASIDYGKSVVFPPYYDVEFESGSFGQAGTYTTYLANRIGLEEALVGRAIESFARELREELNRHNEVILEGLGRLELNDIRQIVFRSDERYWGLPAVADLAVSFVPVPRMKDQVEQQPVSAVEKEPGIIPVSGAENVEDQRDEPAGDKHESALESNEKEVNEATEEVELPIPPTVESEVEKQVVVPAKEKKEDIPNPDPTPAVDEKDQNRRKYGYVIPLMVLLLLLVIPLSYYLLQRDGGHTANTGINTNEIPEDRLNQAPADEDVYSEEESTESNASNENDDLTVAPNEEVEEELVEEENPLEQISEEEATSTHDAEIADDQEPNNSSGHNNQINSSVGEYSNSIASGECVIVVGAFGQGSNMRNMMKELESRGFKVYVDSTRVLSRVGVYSTCERSELHQNLALIRSEVEAQSWILNR